MYTENQSRQLYVVNSVVDSIDNQSVAGAIKFGETADKQEFFFQHKGATEDGLQRSDLVNKCRIMDIRATAADDMKHLMKKVEVSLDPNVNGGLPIVGQDYVLNITINGYIANGNDSIKVKFGAAKAFSADADALYKALALSIAKNFSPRNEPVKMVKITLKGDADATEITNKTKIADLSSITATGVIIEEVEQPWRLGIAKEEFVDFTVQPSTVYSNGMDLVWGIVTDVTADNTNFLPNSKRVAELEYYFHKNRGDVYGRQCYATDIDTVYMVNPSLAAGYSFIDIHFFYEGNSHNVGHSEKTITLVGDKAELDKIVSSIGTALDGYNVSIVKSASW